MVIPFASEPKLITSSVKFDTTTFPVPQSELELSANARLETLFPRVRLRLPAPIVITPADA